MRKYVLVLPLASLLGILFFAYLFYSENGRFPTVDKEALFYVISLALAIVAGMAVRFLDHRLDRLIDWKTLFFSRFLTGFLFNSLFTSLWIVAVGTWLVHLMNHGDLAGFYHQWREEAWKLGILILITFFIYEVFYGWFYSYRYYAITQVGQLRTERWQLELQFESLKSQISPHYLFNCLNTISSLLYRDSHMAEEFIRRMADTFRYILAHQKERLVPLREEIEFVKAYYYLLQVRFEHHLKLEVNLPKNLLDSPVPPLCLQLLVENAVKHNQISKDQPLLVYISALDNTFISVSNTKTTAMQPGAGFRVGLENIRRRYQFFTTEKVQVKDDERFTVHLPVLKNQLASVAGKPFPSPAA